MLINYKRYNNKQKENRKRLQILFVTIITFQLGVAESMILVSGQPEPARFPPRIRRSRLVVVLVILVTVSYTFPRPVRVIRPVIGRLILLLESLRDVVLGVIVVVVVVIFRIQQLCCVQLIHIIACFLHIFRWKLSKNVYNGEFD